MKPISIQLYSVRRAAADDFRAVIEEIAAIGYKGVEPAGLHGREPREVRKWLDDLGLVCSSIHGPVVTKENLNEQVDIAKTLGYDTIVSGRGGDAFKNVEGVREAAEQFQAAAELLEPHGLRMAYHNHWWEMHRIGRRFGYELLMEMAPSVFSELDVYWASNFGQVDVPTLLTEYRKRVPLLHLKDGPLVEGQPHTAVGAGKMDIPAVVRAADPDTLRWLIVELDECATDMMQAVRDSYEYLTGEGLAKGNR